MPIYKFSWDNHPIGHRGVEAVPIPPTEPEQFELDQHPQRVDRLKLTENKTNTQSDEVVRVFADGFKTMDAGIKSYLSSLVVPDKQDGFREVDVRISGGDKTVLNWKQGRRNARIVLPVIAINRTGSKFNETKYSPPYRYENRQFVDREGTEMRLTYRPQPHTISYAVTVWCEHKHDADSLLFQIMTRFNPVAQWTVEDPWMKGVVEAWLDGYTDSSDIDVSPDERAKVRYDFAIRVEGWLPIPGEKIVKTILGRVASEEVEE